MLNWIWLIMVTTAVLLAAATGRMAAVTSAVLERCEAAVMNVMLPMAGLITLWMGIMRLVEQSGLIRIVARAISPVMRRLFPDVPAGHPALGSIAMNLGATMLGAGNAATPMGLRAMSQLNRLNPNPGVASNAMCLLLTINTAGITLIPASTLGVLRAMGAGRPADVILPCILTTLFGTAIGIAACLFLQRFRAFRVQPLPPEEQPSVEDDDDPDDIPHPRPMGVWRRLILLLYCAVPAAGALLYAFSPESLLPLQSAVSGWTGISFDAGTWRDAQPPGAGRRLIEVVSAGIIPSVMGFFILYAAMARVKVFEEFVAGAKDGIHITLRVIPYVLGILVAVAMFRESGGLHLVETLTAPVLHAIGIPVAILPMALIRPLSGGAASGVLADIAAAHGPDSLWTMMAGTINGSSETTFYVAAVYFGAVGVRRMRHSIPAGLIADVAAMFGAVWICSWLLA